MRSSQQRVHISTVRNSSKHPESNLCRRRRQPRELIVSDGTSAVYGRRILVGSAELILITSSPVQNMGHLSHGVSLALPSHALKYGFLTARGTTGGVSFEAPTGRLSSADPAATAWRSQCIEKIYVDSNDVMEIQVAGQSVEMVKILTMFETEKPGLLQNAGKHKHMHMMHNRSFLVHKFMQGYPFSPALLWRFSGQRYAIPESWVLGTPAI